MLPSRRDRQPVDRIVSLTLRGGVALRILSGPPTDRARFPDRIAPACSASTPGWSQSIEPAGGLFLP